MTGVLTRQAEEQDGAAGSVEPGDIQAALGLNVNRKRRANLGASLGERFTLYLGMLLPRDGKAQPGEPDEGTWTFDGKRFKKLAPEAPADKTKVVIRLEPTALY